VQIDDDVEIGANVCIDRGTFGKTHIMRGTKMDNLVQVGHNVQIGENSLVVAQVGIAGSSSLGKNVVLGGQVGIKGHIHLDDGAMVAAKSGVHANLPKGATVAGIPAIPLKDWLRASILFGKLPKLHVELSAMKKQVEKMYGKLFPDEKEG
jgi:UDP-3-O-[3-hydroxymyristoyl] glucosamine N-acyltransferase